MNDALETKAEHDEGSRTELDSHANIPVLGMHCYVISDVGKTATVQPYRPDYDPMDVPLVHAAVRYDCPYSGTTYILVVRNALHVPTMTHNLIPPFMMREVGITVNDVAKIHLQNPTSDDHCIIFHNNSFKIPLLLRGTFSYFDSAKPSKDLMLNCKEVYLLTPTNWDPHTSVHAQNESNMIDWKGDVVEPKYRKKLVLQLDNDGEDDGAELGAVISHIEIEAVNEAMEGSTIF